MANLDHITTTFGLIKGEKDELQTKHKEEYDFSIINKQDKVNSSVKPSSSITDENEFDMAVVPLEQDMQVNGYHATDKGKQIKVAENSISTYLKLKGFFEVVQKQHPESDLELRQLDGYWKVWCGVCKKLLRPDKSGKAIHNIQRQHFTSARHKKKLHLMLEGGETEESRKEAAESRKKAAAQSRKEAAESRKKAAESRKKDAVPKGSETHDNEQGVVEEKERVAC